MENVPTPARKLCAAQVARLVARSLRLNITGSEFVKSLDNGFSRCKLGLAISANPAAAKPEEARGRSGDRAKMERGRQDKS